MKKILIAIVLLIATLAIGIFLSFKNNVSHAVKEESFVIEKPFIAVVKNLATKDSLERMIEESDATLIEKKWEYLDLEVPKRILRIKDYKLNGKLVFVIEKKDADLGDLKIPFVQNVHLDNNVFNVKTNLSSQQKNILFYEKVIEIKPLDERSSKVYLKSEIKIEKTIPFFFKNYMNKKVEQNNEQDFKELKNNLNTIAEKSAFEIKLK